MIDEVIQGNATSTETTPQASFSDAVVDMQGSNGEVFLEAKTPSGEWITVTNQTGSFLVATPDSAISYRFRAADVSSPGAKVYFGP